MTPSEMKNPVARPLWPEYISPAPGRRKERRSAFLGFLSARAALDGAALRSGWMAAGAGSPLGAGSVTVESKRIPSAKA